MKYGFITYVNNNPNYLSLLDILIESILKFTDKEIQVNSMNFYYKHSSDRVITNKVNIGHDNFESVVFNKIKSYPDNNFDYALGLDADAIALRNIENIFKQENLNKVNKFILPPRHPDDVTGLQHLFPFFGVQKQTQPYLHASAFLFGKNSKDFLMEIYNNCLLAKKFNLHLPALEESIMNVTMWKYNLTDQYLPLYDINGNTFLKYVNNEKLDPGEQRCHDAGIFNVDNFLFIHAIKDPNKAKQIFESL